MAHGETGAGRPIGVGIVGCGIIARTHIRALLAFPGETRVTALASRSPESIAAAAGYLQEQARAGAADAAGDDALVEQYEAHAESFPMPFTDWRDLVADPHVDAVIV